MRYIEQAEFEILDTKTNLVWRKDFAETKTFDEALQYAKQMSQETGLDWRVPTIDELSGLLDRCRRNPASNFPDMPTVWFWSSSPYIDSSYEAWGVSFSNGVIYYSYRDYYYAVRLVRNN